MFSSLSHKFVILPSFLMNARAFQHSSLRCRAKILDGSKAAKEICAFLKKDVDEWITAGNRPPRLIVMVIGDDPVSATYVNNKMRAAKDVGIECTKLDFYKSITQSQLQEHIESCNIDPTVDGILVQLPLPNHIDERMISDTVCPEKDVDGFNAVNVGRLCLDLEGFIPCTVLGVRALIKCAGIDTLGKHAVVCGRSKNVGMPIAMLLHSDGHDGKGITLAMDATTTICHRYTPPDQLSELTRKADIVISAVGIPKLIKADMVKKGACVIDIGYNSQKNSTTGKTKVVGDVDFDAVREVAGFITPVPGGVGPMTVAMLMKNTLLAAKKILIYK